MSEEYILFVNDERTVLLRIWTNGTMEVCRREDPYGIWGPPTIVKHEVAA